MQTTQRQPIGFANYPGQCSVDFTRAMGPNYMGELMWPVSASYDPELNQTRVGFSLIPPAEVSA